MGRRALPAAFHGIVCQRRIRVSCPDLSGQFKDRHVRAPRRRGPHGGITMSIDIVPLADGGCRITMWTSDSRRCAWLPIVISQAGVVSERKKAIARLLAEPDPRQLAADSDGMSMQFAGRANSQYW